MKNTFKKAIRAVGGGPHTDFNLVSQLTSSGVLGASVLLPSDMARRASLPSLLPGSSPAELERAARKLLPYSAEIFQVPRIQVSLYNGGSLVATPPTCPSRSIPSESRPQTESRPRSRSLTSRSQF